MIISRVILKSHAVPDGSPNSRRVADMYDLNSAEGMQLMIAMFIPAIIAFFLCLSITMSH